MKTIVKKNCLQCDAEVIGRGDKKFCNTICRSRYKNKISKIRDAIITTTNNTLMKNRRILIKALRGRSVIVVEKGDLLQQGFDPNYLTHTYSNKRGNIYSFCYEYGYLPYKKTRYIVVERNMD